MSAATRWRVQKVDRAPWPNAPVPAWRAVAPIVNCPPEHRYLGGLTFDTHADAIAYADTQARRCKSRHPKKDWPCVRPDGHMHTEDDRHESYADYGEERFWATTQAERHAWMARPAR